jgi:hypothetical protein
MKKAGKASTCYSDNPKMGQPYIRGYKDGGLVYSQPAQFQARKNAPRNIDYAPYDTTMPAQAKAPAVLAGQAPKVTQQASISQPGAVTYYNRGMAAEANRISQQRWDAYNRRLQNAAIESGNPLPGLTRPDSWRTETGEQAQKKAAHYGSKVREPMAMQEQVNKMRQEMQASLTAPSGANKSTAALGLMEEFKRRKEKGKA